MTTDIIKDSHFKRAASGIRPDAKRRITLSKVELRDDVTYHVYTNDLGQIVLDPQITIPASEAWLYLNENAMGAVRRGLYEAAQDNIFKVDLDAP